MTGLLRLVLPGIPHHVTQRGDRRERTFFEDGDYALYLDLLADTAGRSNSERFYCLMPNHVHLIAVPGDEDGLRSTRAAAGDRASLAIVELSAMKEPPQRQRVEVAPQSGPGPP